MCDRARLFDRRVAFLQVCIKAPSNLHVVETLQHPILGGQFKFYNLRWLPNPETLNCNTRDPEQRDLN